MKTDKLLILILILFILTSCTFSKFKRAENTYHNSLEEDINYNITLSEITVVKSTGRDKVRENAENILTILLNNYTREYSLKNEDSRIIDLYASVVIKEETFLKEFETLNTCTIEILLFNNSGLSGNPEVISFLTVDTDTTVTSYKFLYSLIERAVESLFK
jgi:hypothetical protein